MTEIQGKSILVRVSARFELARVRVIGSWLYSERLAAQQGERLALITLKLFPFSAMKTLPPPLAGIRYQNSISTAGWKLRACLHRGGGPQIGEVTCGGSPHLSCKLDQIKMRDYMDRRVTSPTTGVSYLHVNRPQLNISKDDKLERDLLKANKDIAPQSRRILQTFVRWEASSCPQHTTYKFPKDFGTFCSIITPLTYNL